MKKSMMLVAILALVLAAAVPAIAQVSGGGGNPAQGNVMQPGEVLNPGQSLSSADGRYNFVYQGDGNLVLYDAGGTPMWSSGTNGTPAGASVMQDDGNLVIYGPGEEPVWASGTYGNPGSSLWAQVDGNVVIYRPDDTPVWATNTAQPLSELPLAPVA